MSEEMKKLNDEDLDLVSGGVYASIDGDVITITWLDGEQIRYVNNVVDGYKSVLTAWGVSVDRVKKAVEDIAKTKYKASIARYVATVAGKVVINKDGTINGVG